MGLVDIARAVLPYTVGNGQPAYRTNPATGQKYTFSELTQKAIDTEQRYQVSNPYLAVDKQPMYIA